jgi:FAD/FMN-containing dehydrogenase
MNKVLQVDKAAYTMEVQAQMMLSQLFAAATAAGMSPPSVMPAWAELSLAGIMASSAHGSGRNISSVIVSGRLVGSSNDSSRSSRKSNRSSAW